MWSYAAWCVVPGGDVPMAGDCVRPHRVHALLTGRHTPPPPCESLMLPYDDNDELSCVVVCFQDQAQGVLSLRLKINLPIDMDQFHEYLKQKNVEDEEIECDKTTALKKIKWTETNSRMWGGCNPVVEVLIDEKYAFLLKAYIQYEKKKGNLREKAIKEVFYDGLRYHRVLKAEVVENEDGAPLTETGIS